MMSLEQRFNQKQRKIAQVSSWLSKQAVQPSVKQGIFVNLKPRQRELEELSPLWNAVDMLITHDCFGDNNPMRLNSGDILFWDWTIVTVGGFRIPAPIHTCSKTESFLYTSAGEEVILSNEECAYTTTIFYLDHLMELTQHWPQIEDMIYPDLKIRLSPSVNILQKISPEQFSSILHRLRSKLSDKGFSVLN